MKLQILVPQYKETDDVVRGLLDSLAFQRNINFDDIGVIIANDGTDIRLSETLLNSYPFEIKYILSEHAGVSATRNRCLDAATADYVMFCDADDRFFNMLGLETILKTIEQTPFDAMNSAFVEELLNPATNKYAYRLRENDAIFVHGKVYSRKFLLDNNIRWGDELLAHEDSYFNCLAMSLSKTTRYCPKAFYLWCWNNSSVSRGDPYYIVNTYDQLLHSAGKLSHDLVERGAIEAAAAFFALNMWQSFYIITGKFGNIAALKEKIRSLEFEFRDFYANYSYLLDKLSDQEKFQINANARNAAAQHGWFEENTAFNRWLSDIEIL